MVKKKDRKVVPSPAPHHISFRFKVSMGLKLVAVLGLIIVASLDAYSPTAEVPNHIYAGLFGLAYGLDKDDIMSLIRSWLHKNSK